MQSQVGEKEGQFNQQLQELIGNLKNNDVFCFRNLFFGFI